MARSLILPLQWCRLHPILSPKAHILRQHGAQACTARAVTNSNTITPKRPFHTTQNRSALRPSRRAPSVRRQKVIPEHVLVSEAGLRIDRDGFCNTYCTAHVEPTLAEFKQFARQIYENYEGVMPPGVNLATFVSVGEQLIKLSHSQFPSASLVRSISIGEFKSQVSK